MNSLDITAAGAVTAKNVKNINGGEWTATGAITATEGVDDISGLIADSASTITLTAANDIANVIADGTTVELTATNDIANVSAAGDTVNMTATAGDVANVSVVGETINLTATAGSIVNGAVDATGVATLKAEAGEIDGTTVTAASVNATAKTIAASAFIGETGEVKATADTIDATSLLAKANAVTVDANAITGDSSFTAVGENGIVTLNGTGENAIVANATINAGAAANLNNYTDVNSLDITAAGAVTATNVQNISGGTWIADGAVTATTGITDISGLTVKSDANVDLTATTDIVNVNVEGSNVTIEATNGSIINSGVYAGEKASLTAGDEIDGTFVTAQGISLPETGEVAITALADYIGASSFIAERGDIEVGSETRFVKQLRDTTVWAKLGKVKIFIDPETGELDGMALTAGDDLVVTAAYIVGSTLVSEKGNVDVTANQSLAGSTVLSKKKDVIAKAARIEANTAIDAIEGNIYVGGAKDTFTVEEDGSVTFTKNATVDGAVIMDATFSASADGKKIAVENAKTIDGSVFRADNVKLASAKDPVVIGADGPVTIDGAETITLDNVGNTNIVSNNNEAVTVYANNGGDKEVISIAQNGGDLTVIDDGTIKIGQITADGKVAITAENSILDGTANETANITADKVELTAKNGNVGDENEALNLLVKEITGKGITAENGGVYLMTDGALRRDINGRKDIADITAQTVKIDAADGIGEITYVEDGEALSDTVGQAKTDAFLVINGASNVELTTTNGDADIAIELENATTVDLTAMAKGNDSDIFVTTDDVRTLNLRHVSAIDGNVVIGAARSNVNAIHVRALDNGDVTGIVNDAHEVVIEASSISIAANGIRSDYYVDLTSYGDITGSGDSSIVNITAGGDINIEVGGQVGNVGNNNPLTVETDGELHVDSTNGNNNGAGKDIVWVFANGRTSDGAIHYDGKPNSEPGVIYWNGRVWGGNNEPVNRVSRAEGEFNQQIRYMIDAYNGKYWTVSQLIYFPHVYMMMDLKPQDMSIEHILNGRGTIENLPDGVLPDTIDINSWDDSFSWYQGNGWQW